MRATLFAPPSGQATASETSAIIRLMPEKVRIPAAMQERAAEVIAVTDGLCLNDLNAEYAKLARRLVARLARKRPSPLARGDARSWAAGALYVLAQVNFLFDRTQSPHMTSAELATAVGVKQTTMVNKAGRINRSLGIGMFEPELTRVAMLEQHPAAWIVELSNGLLVDARTLPEEMQAEARRLGLIPDLEALRAAA